MISTDWKPDRTDMHRAFAAWRASEKPSIWHPLYTKPFHEIIIMIAEGGRGEAHTHIQQLVMDIRAGKAVPESVTVAPMRVILRATRMADKHIGCICGEVGVMHTRTLSTVLDGPFLISGTYVESPRYSDTDLWLPPDAAVRSGYTSPWQRTT